LSPWQNSCFAEKTYRVIVSQGASSRDFPLALACPIEELTLWVGLLDSMLVSEIGEGIETKNLLPELGIKAGTAGPRPNVVNVLSTKRSFHGPLFLLSALSSADWNPRITVQEIPIP